MKESKINTIRKDLEQTYDAMCEEIERLEEYEEETYWTIRDLENAVRDFEQGFYECIVYNYEALKQEHYKNIEKLEEQKELYNTIRDELASMRIALAKIEKALDAICEY